MQERDIDLYLRRYPYLHKWLNVCAACGARGHKPEMPENIFPGPNVAARHLRKVFRPLELNEMGLCPQCEAANVKCRTEGESGRTQAMKKYAVSLYTCGWEK
jgi:hypothetical protein